MHIIKAKEDAAQRTKNRINEYGPEFRIKTENADVSIKGITVQACLVVANGGAWVGWLPLDEIIIEESVDSVKTLKSRTFTVRDSPTTITF